MAITKVEWQSATYTVSVGELETPVTLTLTLDAPNEDANVTGLRATWSHQILTPAHSGPYAPGSPNECIEFPVRPGDVTPIARKLARLFCVSYTEAVEAGVTPDESWLIPAG